jgi:hypothetical protein
MYRAHVDTLTVPVFSPFLGRDVLISPRQFRLLCLLMRKPKGWKQRELAAEAGYETPGGVSRTLHHLARLGVVAISITRGCKGSTVAWLRRGVVATRRQIWNVAYHDRRREPYVDSGLRGVRQHSVSEVLAGLFGVRGDEPVRAPEATPAPSE